MLAVNLNQATIIQKPYCILCMYIYIYIMVIRIKFFLTAFVVIGAVLEDYLGTAPCHELGLWLRLYEGFPPKKGLLFDVVID